MKKLFIKPINRAIELKNQITRISIENVNVYRNLAFNYEDNFIYSIDNLPLKIEKDVLMIINPLNISLNESKLIKLLYKNLEISKSNDYSEEIKLFEVKLMELIEKITENSVIPINYNERIDIQKIFSSIGLSYMESEDYLENVINYIKLYNEYFNSSLVISFGLVNLLNKNEQELLNLELVHLQIKLVDIDFKNEIIKYNIILDEDLCEV